MTSPNNYLAVIKVVGVGGGGGRFLLRHAGGYLGVGGGVCGLPVGGGGVVAVADAA